MQVKEYLKNLNIHKSVGPDDKNPKVWRELVNAALQISIQNNSFTIIFYQTTLLSGNTQVVK